MKRTSINAVVDGLSFVAFSVLVSTGLILQYQLPPGSGRLHGYGSGHGAAARHIELLWGWTRHDWGQIHYWMAITMTAVLAVHLLFHWKWIVCTLRGTPSVASGHRFILGIIGLVFTIILAVAPLISSTTSTPRSELQESRSASQ